MRALCHAATPRLSMSFPATQAQWSASALLLATSALPIVLPPVERNGLVLIDGGLLNNVPFDVAYARGAMHVLAVDLTNAAEYGANGEQIPPGGVRSRILKVPKLFGTWQVLNAVMDLSLIHI